MINHEGPDPWFHESGPRKPWSWRFLEHPNIRHHGLHMNIDGWWIWVLKKTPRPNEYHDIIISNDEYHNIMISIWWISMISSWRISYISLTSSPNSQWILVVGCFNLMFPWTPSSQSKTTHHSSCCMEAGCIKTNDVDINSHYPLVD